MRKTSNLGNIGKASLIFERTSNVSYKINDNNIKNPHVENRNRFFEWSVGSNVSDMTRFTWAIDTWASPGKIVGA